ncbi:o-succinylbenzoate synthase, partial [candidate division KSB1 bacterium]
MIQIERLTLREIRLPLKEPFEISSGTVTDRRIFLLQLRDVNGVTGWGECVLGRTFHHPREIFPVLEENFRGHNMAKAAVEMGAWELAAQIQGVPLSRLLGGTRAKIAAGISLGIQKNPEILVEKARACRAQGYRKIKVKIKPGADVAFVAAVREALGP